MKKSLCALVVVFALTLIAVSTEAAPQKKSKKKLGGSSNIETLAKKVRKELVTIPFFGVFDWLEGNVEPDGTVTLRGQVTRPTIKSDAKNRVERIEGVEKVVNQIEVLPLSNQDDRLRQAVYRELFNANSPLQRYALGVIPSIHIIINNGRLTLKGIVNNKSDSDIANVRASTISGLFEVKNELQVERSKK